MTPDNNNQLLDTLIKIQSGDTLTREDFLREYKPFIAKTAMNLCKRPLLWESSDELSLALIAFNTAIDSYDVKRQVPFLPYAKVIIHNKLKDLFRKEQHRREIPLEIEVDGVFLNPAEVQSAWEDFRDRSIEEERRDELVEYETNLKPYGIDFEALVNASPKHKDSRQTLFEIAKFMAENQSLMAFLKDKKQLPLNELVTKTGVNRKTLERGRKFIIATALVLHYPMNYTYIHSYINLG